MGLWGALRRWWRGEGLPRCFLCAKAVPRRDLERGLALVIGREPYCRACVKLFTGRPGAGGGLADSSSHATP